MNYVRIGSLSIARALYEFIEQEAAPGTSISAKAFWSGFAELLRDCGMRNRQLLQVAPDELQSRIDQYHRERSVEKQENGYGKVQSDLTLMRRAGELPYSWLADNTRWQRLR